MDPISREVTPMTDLLRLPILTLWVLSLAASLGIAGVLNARLASRRPELVPLLARVRRST
jgi:hypothetical protein